jgi:hypothetical protein
MVEVYCHVVQFLVRFLSSGYHWDVVLLRLVTLFPLLTGLILLAFASRPETRSGMRNVHAPRHSHDFCCSSFQLL